MTDEERALDSYLSWQLGTALQREILIRRGDLDPRPDNPTEIRWAFEGERDNAELDGVKS